ncbi:DsbA family oxidoreductase [Aurantivibrio infirmus]
MVSTEEPKLNIAHFSDVLCIWAYVSQIRMQELATEFSDRVQIDFHFFSVFGDVPGKIKKQWESRGGLSAYSEHVKSVAAQFEHLHLHPQVWTKAPPKSSLPAHLYLSAIAELEEHGNIASGKTQEFTASLRRAFFVDAKNISDEAELKILCEELSLPLKDIKSLISDASAYARLSRDMNLAKDLNVRASPTIIFNEDRQRLTGNVGYKIIKANIKELIDQPIDASSWC